MDYRDEQAKCATDAGSQTAQCSSRAGAYRTQTQDPFITYLRRQRVDLQQQIAVLSGRLDVISTIIDAVEG